MFSVHVCEGVWGCVMVCGGVCEGVCGGEKTQIVSCALAGEDQSLHTAALLDGIWPTDWLRGITIYLIRVIYCTSYNKYIYILCYNLYMYCTI